MDLSGRCRDGVEQDGTKRRAIFDPQLLAGQLRDAVVLGSFGEHAALKHSSKLDEGKAVVLLEQQAQAVGQFDFLDGIVAGQFRR